MSTVGIQDVLQASGVAGASVDCVKKAASRVALSAQHNLNGFLHIKAYTEALKESNPNLQFDLYPSDGGDFNKLMVMLPSSVKAFPHSFQIVGVDNFRC